MLDINVALFLIFDMLIVGLAITAFRAIKVNNRLNNFWRISLLLMAASYGIFAAAPYIDRFFLTPANVFLIGSCLFMGMLFRSWNKPVTRQLFWSFLIGLFFFSIAFEYLRRYGTFQQRVFLVSGLLILCSIWEIFELIRLNKRAPGFYPKLLIALVSIYLFFTSLRLYLVMFGSDPSTINLYNENILAFTSRWGLMAANVLSYIAINGYFTEQSWVSETVAINSQLENLQTIASLQYEVTESDKLNHRLRSLLEDKNGLLKRLSMAEKTGMLGALAGSLAHELNQPLCATKINIDTLKQIAADQPDAALLTRLLIDIENDSLRVEKIVKRVDKLFRRGSVEFGEIPIRQLIHDCCDLLAKDLEKQKINVMLDVDPSVQVHGDHGQLETVVLNLLTNAMDALKNIAHEKRIKIWMQVNDQHATLNVDDNGHGIPVDELDQIFDPFYTNKNHGMGIGLWLTKSIAEHHRARIKALNLPGGGARFEIQFSKFSSSEHSR